MSKVTEELNFLWRERLAVYYDELRTFATFEGNIQKRYLFEMESIRNVLELQGLTVKGIEN